MKISIKKIKKPEKTAVVFLSKEKNIPNSVNVYKNMIESLFKEKIFKGDRKTSFFIPIDLKSSKKTSYKYLLFVGLGDEKSFDYEGVRQASAKANKELKVHGQKTADIFVESLVTKNTKDWERLCQSLSEGLILSDYKCRDFKKPDKQEKEVTELFLCVPPNKQSGCHKGLRTGQILGETTNFAKNLLTFQEI